MNRGFYAFARTLVRTLLGLFWRFRVVDAANVPLDGPLILACNHMSYFDPPALGAAATRPVTYMAKQELFKIPVLGPIITGLGAFPVDRSRGDVAAIKTAIGVLERGTCLGIFPEGGIRHGEHAVLGGNAIDKGPKADALHDAVDA